jgi:hypothetical protein
MQKRAEDAAVQIAVYSLCGDQEFASRLRNATLESGKFFQKLSACSSERIDAKLIFDDATTYVKGKMAGIRCDTQMQSMIINRRAFFEDVIKQANDPSVSELILKDLGIKIDDSSNITDNTWESSALPFQEDSKGKQAANSLVKAFIGTCVQVVPRLDLIEGTAKLLGWKQINGMEGTLVAPSDPKAVGKTWLVENAADVPFMLATSRAVKEGKTISVCTVANPNAPESSVRASLIEILKLDRPLKVELEGGQRYTYWQTTFSGVDIVLTLIDASPSKDPGINLSAIVEENAN